jgi:hypothetical protein
MRHPDIFIVEPKEPCYFAKDFPGLRYVSKLDDYLALFAQGADCTVRGDGSVWYFYSQAAIPEIKKFCPEAKIIVMLRNPVDMVYSLHSQLLFGRDEIEASFECAFNLIQARKRGQEIPWSCKTREKLYYDEVASFGRQLEKLWESFPKQQTKIVFFEDFIRNTEKIYEDILNFLEVPSFSYESFPIINANKRSKNIWLANFTQRPPKALLAAAMRFKTMLGIERYHILDYLRKRNTIEEPRPELSIEMKKRIIEAYSSDILKLQTLTGRDLSNWMTP